jgi:hypothetical protein
MREQLISWAPTVAAAGAIFGVLVVLWVWFATRRDRKRALATFDTAAALMDVHMAVIERRSAKVAESADRSAERGAALGPRVDRLQRSISVLGYLFGTIGEEKERLQRQVAAMVLPTEKDPVEPSLRRTRPPGSTPARPGPKAAPAEEPADEPSYFDEPAEEPSYFDEPADEPAEEPSLFDEPAEGPTYAAEAAPAPRPFEKPAPPAPVADEEEPDEEFEYDLTGFGSPVDEDDASHAAFTTSEPALRSTGEFEDVDRLEDWSIVDGEEPEAGEEEEAPPAPEPEASFFDEVDEPDEDDEPGPGERPTSDSPPDEDPPPRRPFGHRI